MAVWKMELKKRDGWSNDGTNKTREALVAEREDCRHIGGSKSTVVIENVVECLGIIIQSGGSQNIS